MSHTENDSHNLLRRILGEEEAGDILAQVQARQSDQQLLAAAGIDAEAMLTRATAQITLAEQLAEHGVTPPRTIEHLTDDEFQALSNEDLEHYLAGYGIDIDALLARTEQLIEDQAPQPAANWLTKLGGFLPRWPTGPALGAAVSAVLALGVGITVLRMLPPEKPPVATASLPAKPEAVTLARSATVNGKPAAPGADLDSAPAAASSEVASLLTDKSTAVQLASATAESIRKDESLKRQEMAMESKAVMEQETVMRAAEEKKKMADASNPPETLLSATASSAAPARTNFDFYTVLPEMETVAAREKVTASVETAAPSPAAALKVDLKKPLDDAAWAVTSTAPVTAAPAAQITEFIFGPGDTLSHGMASSGLPTKLWAALAERVGNDFRPGDKAIFYFENDQFEQLVIIRRKKERTTVTADLKTNTVPVGTTTTIEITGKIQTSLYVALEEKLNAAVAQRISWLLQSRDVPLTTLPKGSTFSVRIEQITGPDGETLRFGAIKNVQLDAGHKGNFTVGKLSDVDT
ncbi:MAG: hypothetical protein QF841_04775 [Arenicellales bacterium]|nr:hypothetical protein [Arenicellales bacterium]